MAKETKPINIDIDNPEANPDGQVLTPPDSTTDDDQPEDCFENRVLRWKPQRERQEREVRFLTNVSQRTIYPRMWRR
jgi:hypothetical protein